MGAELITVNFKVATFDEVKKRVEDLADSDRHEYGHNAYSGSWNNCSRVDNTGRVFDDYEKAEKYLLDKAEKWGPALAAKITGQEDWKSREAMDEYEKSRKKALGESKRYQALVGRAAEAKGLIEKKLAELDGVKEEHRKKVLSGRKRHECKKCGGGIPVEKISVSGGVWSPVDHVIAGGAKDLRLSKMPGCPLCNESIVPTSAAKKIDTIVVKLEDLAEKYNEAKKLAKEADEKINAKARAKATTEETLWLVVYVAPC